MASAHVLKDKNITLLVTTDKVCIFIAGASEAVVNRCYGRVAQQSQTCSVNKHVLVRSHGVYVHVQARTHVTVHFCATPKANMNIVYL